MFEEITEPEQEEGEESTDQLATDEEAQGEETSTQDEKDSDETQQHDWKMAEIRELRAERRAQREQNAAMQKQITDLQEGQSKRNELGYDEQINNLRKLKAEFPERGEDLDEAIIELKLEKKVEERVERLSKTHDEKRLQSQWSSDYQAALDKAYEIEPRLKDPDSKETRDAIAIGLDIGLLTKNAQGELIPVTSKAPLTLAKMLKKGTGMSTSQKSSSSKSSKMPDIGGGRSGAGAKSVPVGTAEFGKLSRDKQIELLRAHTPTVDLKKRRRMR